MKKAGLEFLIGCVMIFFPALSIAQHNYAPVNNRLSVCISPLASGVFEFGDETINLFANQLSSAFSVNLKYERHFKSIGLSGALQFANYQGSFYNADIGILGCRSRRLEMPLGVEWFVNREEKVSPVAATGILLSVPLQTRYFYINGTLEPDAASILGLEGSFGAGAWLNGGIQVRKGPRYFELRAIWGYHLLGNVQRFHFFGISWSAGHSF